MIEHHNSKMSDYYERIQRAVDFIEENLIEDVSLSDISKKAFSSLSHFHRIFYFMTGFTIKEYVRKRRMSVAATELMCTQRKVIDIALDCRYESHESFSRAFQQMFGLSPMQFRKTKKEHLLLEKLDVFKSYAKQEYNGSIPILEFILHKEIYMIGSQITTTLAHQQQSKDIPAFFSEFASARKYEEISDVLSPNHLLGVYTDMTDLEQFSFTLGCEVSPHPTLPKGMVSHQLPASKYARFTVDESIPPKILAAWTYIYGFWMPRSQEARGRGYDFEVYLDWKKAGKTMIYIPITS